MACHGCATPFGFLKKEVGCPKCGFSFCKHCLRFKLMDQDKHKNVSVCQLCYTSGSGVNIPPEKEEELTRQWKETATVIKAVRRLESLDNPVKPPITVYRESTSSRLSNLKKGLSMEDQKIVERLQELRSSGENQSRRKSTETVEDVAARLARLRGEDPAAPQESNKGMLLRQKPETEQELFNRLANQVDLDQKYEARMTGDIHERLAKLRGTASDTTNTGGAERGSDQTHSVPDMNMELDEIMDEDISEEEQVQKIINQFVAQVALEEKLGSGVEVGVGQDLSHSGQPHMETFEDDDEDDDIDVSLLCRICDEKRATLECKVCDNDIFCAGCFKEFHIELGEFHKSTPFPPK